MKSVFLPLGLLIGLVGCFGLASTRAQGLLVNSLLLSIGACAIAVPLGVVLALAMIKTSLPGWKALQWILVGLLFVPLFVQAAAWQSALRYCGSLLSGNSLRTRALFTTGWLPAIWTHGITGVAWVTLILAAALRTIPREEEENALQDAPAYRVLWTISLRHAFGAIFAAMLWIAVICFSEITVTDLYQVRTFAEEVYTSANIGTLGTPLTSTISGQAGVEISQRDLAKGSVVALLLMLSLLTAVARSMPSADFLSVDSGWRWQVRNKLPLAVVTWLLITLLIGVPFISLVSKAGIHVTRNDAAVERVWSLSKAAHMVARSPWEHRRELTWTCVIGVTVASLATTLGLLLAWGTRVRWLPRLPTLCMMAGAFAIPGPLVGVWLIALLNHEPGTTWSWLNWYYDNTVLAPVLAQLMRALPFATLLLWSQMASIPQAVLDCARTEGASPWRQLWAIALPMRWPVLVSAFSLSLIVSVGELSATLLVVPPGVTTLSTRIFGLLHYGAEDRVSAICLALAVLLGIGTVIAGWPLRMTKDTNQCV